MSKAPQYNPRGSPQIFFTPEKLSELADSLREWTYKHIEKNELMLLKKWCFENKFNPRYFPKMIERSEDFKDAYTLAKEWQEYTICWGALKNTLNPRFAQFFLGCNHNWRTKDANDSRLSELTNDFKGFLEYMKTKKSAETEDEDDDEC